MLLYPIEIIIDAINTYDSKRILKGVKMLKIGLLGIILIAPVGSHSFDLSTLALSAVLVGRVISQRLFPQ
jgi:hypothetical protein